MSKVINPFNHPCLNQHYTGVVDFHPDTYLDVCHHCAFGCNQHERIGYNSNPHGEGKYIKINNFTITEDGFSFQKGNDKHVTKCHDKTPFEKQLTKELYQLINNFSILDGYYTGFDGTWTSTEVLSFDFVSWEHGYSSDFLALNRCKDKLFTGNGPIIEQDEVYCISFKTDEINLETSQGDIHYKYNLNPYLYSLLKFFFLEGFSEFIK